MTPAGFYSVFFRGSQAPQGRPGRFFCSAWPEEGDPGKAARRSGPCGRCLPGGPGAALPFRGHPGMDTARIRQKSAPGKTTRVTGTARCPRRPLPRAGSLFPFLQEAPGLAGSARSRRTSGSLSPGGAGPRGSPALPVTAAMPPAAGRAARKKDLTPAHEWHTYHATPRCGVYVGK